MTTFDTGFTRQAAGGQRAFGAGVGIFQSIFTWRERFFGSARIPANACHALLGLVTAAQRKKHSAPSMNIIRFVFKMSPAPAGFLCAIVFWAVGLLAGPVSAAIVTLKVVDQHGQEIPGSRINVLSQDVNSGDSVLLPVGEQ